MSLETNGFDTSFYTNTAPVRNELTVTMQLPIAVRYGAAHALVVDAIERGIPDQRKGAVWFSRGGHRWFCCSCKGFGRILPFVDLDTIKAAIAELEAAGVIISQDCRSEDGAAGTDAADGADGAKLYRLNYRQIEREYDAFTQEALAHDEYYDDGCEEWDDGESGDEENGSEGV